MNGTQRDYDSVISSVAYPAYSATPADHTYRLSDDIHLKLKGDTNFRNLRSRHEEDKLWLVQGVFSTEREIPENIIEACDTVQPKLICADSTSSAPTYTYQMQPIIEREGVVFV